MRSERNDVEEINSTMICAPTLSRFRDSSACREKWSHQRWLSYTVGFIRSTAHKLDASRTLIQFEVITEAVPLMSRLAHVAGSKDRMCDHDSSIAFSTFATAFARVTLN